MLAVVLQQSQSILFRYLKLFFLQLYVARMGSLTKGVFCNQRNLMNHCILGVQIASLFVLFPLPFADEAALSEVYLKVIALSILINVGFVW